MNLSFANPAGLALLALTVPIIVLHILKPRRHSVTVSSTFLWRAIERPVSSATPWQKLRWSWLLIAQLLSVILLALAVAKPVRLEDSALAEHTVFIVDASGSMRATDGAPDRLASAIDKAVALRNQMPTGGLASIVVAADRPRVVLTTSDDRDAFRQALRTVQASPGAADFPAAFSLAESLDTAAQDVGFVLVSDGGLTDEEQRLLPPGTRYERVGADNTNRGISQLSVEARGTGLHARIGVRNYGNEEVTQPVRIDVDGKTVVSQSLVVPPRSVRDLEADLPQGDRVEAYLDGGDLLAVDDVAVAVAPRRPTLKVLIVGDPSFWEQLYTSIPGVTVDLAAPKGNQAVPDGDGYDMVIYNQVAVPAEPQASFVAVAPPGGAPGVAASGVVENPVITLLRTTDPLLERIDLTRLAIAQAQRVTTETGDVLVSAERAPLLIRGEAKGRRYLYLPFVLTDSNLPVQLAFPILGDRMLAELAGLAMAADSLELGQQLPIDPARAAEVTDPNGNNRSVIAGAPGLRAELPGFWTIATEGRPERVVAVNPADRESDISPRQQLAPQPIEQQRLVTPARIQHSLLPWLIPALLVLLAVETWLAWRRLGVGRKQWRSALVLRGVVGALLIGALIAPHLSRSSNRVATVFLLDGSASMGAAGTDLAVDWVREAMATRPDDALSAVVVFGGDARLDRVLQSSSAFDGPAVVIDQKATDMATALRLGSAVLPSDAKRRVVIVSDGRANVGDAQAEAERLGFGDIQIDVHTIERAQSNDVAVGGIDVPRLARVGDKVDVTVNVVASNAGPVTVELRRNGTTVGTKTIDATPGVNKVVFTDTAGSDAGTVLRYQAVVTASADALPENDSAFAAVPVDGPARVLVVEGTGDEAATLINALTAGGIATDVVGPAEIPNVQNLATYSGIVMVDVHADDLTGEQIEALAVAVRDLGRGLVTIGGERSYGVGGYRDSPLSDLLPVDSEILDPKRRKTVAEVLSIDTSGSMAACHCDDPNGGGSEEGGINKTDISRAAAERTIEALTELDEVGVLAWNSGTEWVIDLQQLPSQGVIDEGLGRLRPNGSTNLRESLDEAVDALLKSDAELKHIILFTDGFTDLKIIGQVADRAGEIYNDNGITVSVLGTGEGAAPSLEDIAVQGHGRYYPGTNISDVPQIMAEEAVIASRDFINEGSFLPEITSADPVVAPLESSPPLLGYIATTAKSQSSTLMRIGPDRDPLLATWQAGLGRVTSWTSDASSTWSQQWAGWDGYVDFWSRVVKSTFQDGEIAGAAQARVRNGQLEVTVEGAGNFPDGAVGTATIAGPDGQRIEITLDRVSGDRFEGRVPAPRSGTYAVGVQVTGTEGDTKGQVVLSASTLASDSYPAEFEPGEADATFLTRLSTLSGGRGEIKPAAAFEAGTLAAGMRRLALAGPFLVAAALLFPLAVAMSRLMLRGATVAGARAGLARSGNKLRSRLPRLGAPDPLNTGAAARPVPRTPASTAEKPTTSASDTPPPPPATRPATSATLSELLEKKRSRQG